MKRFGRIPLLTSLIALPVIAGLTLSACKDDGGDDRFGNGDNGMTDAGDVGDGDGDGDGDGGGKLDAMGDGDGDGDDGQGAVGCKAVDFLFVIDNSGSMEDEQNSLISSFPGFIDAIDSTLDVQQDYHIMVTDTDGWLFEGCPDYCQQLPLLCLFPTAQSNPGCVTVPDSCSNLDGDTTNDCPPVLGVDECDSTDGDANNDCVRPPMHCNDMSGILDIFPGAIPGDGQTLSPDYGQWQCDNPDTPELENANNVQPGACDLLGAGIDNPIGPKASNMDCGFTNDKLYIDKGQGSLQDIKDAFSCAAKVGTGGNGNEKPMEAMVKAVKGSSSGALSSCNEGFVRDSAILVVVFITDEDDADDDSGTTPKSAGSPSSWKSDLVAAKNGDESGVVVLGIYSNGSNILDQFVDQFGGQGFKGNINGGNYQQFLMDAVSTIATTCDDYVPPAG